MQLSNTKMASTSNTQNEGSSYIDLEALFQILARVPPESLVQCKRVGRFWLSTIRDPNFLKFRCDNQHLNGYTSLKRITGFNTMFLLLMLRVAF